MKFTQGFNHVRAAPHVAVLLTGDEADPATPHMRSDTLFVLRNMHA